MTSDVLSSIQGEAQTGLITPPLSVYVHIPWCIRKCPYCDFNSHSFTGELPESDYLAALLQDLHQDKPLAQGRAVTSVFFGGGTPSLMSAQTIGAILNAIDRELGLAPQAEITLEANPGTAEQSRFNGYRAAGVNRLSIGVQSFEGQYLHQLGRIHSGREALSAAGMARKAGFERLNLDLMHGLPGQRASDACADLNQAIDLGPEHISWYQLTIEPNTQFYNDPPLLPVEDSLADIQAQGETLLAQAGYQQYEVSAYARPGEAARHNLNYWQYGDYLGLGAGAHAKITQPDRNQIIRFWKTRQPGGYLTSQDRLASQHRPPGAIKHGNPYTAGLEALTPEALPLDFLLNALRLNDGVPSRWFCERTGLRLQALNPQWPELREKGLVKRQPGRLVATELGRRFLNDLLAHF